LKVSERTITVPASEGDDVIGHFRRNLESQLNSNEQLVRFVVSNSDEKCYLCEIAVISDDPSLPLKDKPNLFYIRRRKLERSGAFNAVLLVPTGIGADIGGHAGDATAVARMIAESCDQLVLHPNVVNASDINELPENALYVEGSVLTRLMMGAVGLQPVRSNRVLVLLDNHKDRHFVDAAVNSVSASRATFGLDCPEVVCLEPPVKMYAEYSESGRAGGRIEGLGHCLDVLKKASGKYDAVAISSIIRVPHEYHQGYFVSKGEMVNPWGGVEAMLTHAISTLLDVPSAHSPMLESKEIENIEPGIVEPRISAEAVSLTYLQCILKGLHKAPKIISDEALLGSPEVFSVEDISCLIIPDGCLGLPTLAALVQGVTVIAVRENRNLMRNDLSKLPWREGQFIQVENYLEAVGVMNAIKAGVTLDSIRRPITATRVRTATENRSASRQTGEKRTETIQLDF
jgi:hypothetical protein